MPARLPLLAVSLSFIAVASGCVAADETEDETLGVSRSALVDPPLILEAERADGAGYVERDPSASGGAARVLDRAGTAAAMSFTTTATTYGATVRVRSSFCFGPPTVQVFVDDRLVRNQTLPFGDTSWNTYPLYVKGMPAGSHRIRFEYDSGVTCAVHFDVATFTFLPD